MEQVKCYKFGQHSMLPFSVFISDISSPEDLFEGTKDRLFFVSIFLTLKLDDFLKKRTDTLDLVLGLSIVKTTSLYPDSRSLFRKSLEWKKKPVVLSCRGVGCRSSFTFSREKDLKFPWHYPWLSGQFISIQNKNFAKCKVLTITFTYCAYPLFNHNQA